MSEQLSLLDPPLARRRDPVTSHAAAARVVEFSGAHHVAILAALREHGTGTVYDLEGWTGISAHRIGKRMHELENAGRVKWTGGTAPSPSGRECRVWRAA